VKIGRASPLLLILKVNWLLKLRLAEELDALVLARLDAMPFEAGDGDSWAIMHRNRPTQGGFGERVDKKVTLEIPTSRE
jgi:hypothetical protein